MRKYLWLLLFMVAGCSHPISPKPIGAFAPFTRSNAGPGVPISRKIIVRNEAGVTVVKFKTDSTGLGVALLLPGRYTWAIADSNWNIEYYADSIDIEEDSKIERKDSLIWPMTVEANKTRRDTVVFCPFCM